MKKETKTETTLSELVKDLIEISLGKKKPKTWEQKQLAKDLKAVRGKKGAMMDIPYD